MKKVFTLFFVFCMLIVTLLPVTALASGTDTQQTENNPEGTPVSITDSGITDTGLGEPQEGVSVMSANSVGPAEYTKSLNKYYHYDDSGKKVYYYMGYALYTAPAKGFYTFYSVTNQDTDIYFFKNDALIDRDITKDKPFSMWVYLESGEDYEIDYYNYGSSSSITYLLTTPSALGSAAYSISPKGYSKSWLQAFDFDAASDGDYSLHIAGLSDSSFGWALWKGADYDFEESGNSAAAVTGEWFHTFSLETGTYHLVLSLKNSKSSTASFTIAMDNADGVSELSEGASGGGALTANDTLTTDLFTPDKTGKYTFTLSPGGAKLTVMSEAGEDTNTCVVNNALTDTVLNLESGTKYHLYYVTTGAAETLNYSVSYIPSDKCELISVGNPFSFDGHIATATVDSAETPLAVTAEVSPYAQPWKLYSDSGCNNEIADGTMDLSEGLNKAYIEVTSEDKAHTAVYPLLLYVTGSADPVILAYDSNYNEISDNSVLTGSTRVIFLGKSPLDPDVTQDGNSYTLGEDGLITEDGAYAIDLTDGNSHSADTLHFDIDNTAPVVSAASGGNPISTGALCNKDVVVTVTEPHPDTSTATKDGADYVWPSDNTFTEDGKYVVMATDLLGHSSAPFTFTIDKTPPKITAVPYKGSVLSDGGYTNKSYVTVTVTDYKTKSATKDGKSYKWPSRSRLSSSGKYVITASDAAGNVSTLTFTIDNTKPAITAKADTKTVKNNGSTNKYVTVTVKDTNLDPAYPTATEDGSSIAWPTGGVFTGEGKYVITAKDKSGNISTLTFTIDLMPVLTATTVDTSTTVTNKMVTAESVNITYSDKYMKSKTLTKNGKKIAWPTETTPRQFDLTGDGVYSITLKDNIGNKISTTFTIDKTAPVIKATPRNGSALSDGGYTNKSYVTVKITDLTSLKVKKVTKNGAAVTYPSSGKFTAEGKYVITATDSAGNTSTFTFTIDRTVPVITAMSGSTPVFNNATVSTGVDLSLTEANLDTIVITKDSADFYQYPRDSATWDGTGTYTLTQNGKYVITVTDKAGNKATLTFTINQPV